MFALVQLNAAPLDIGTSRSETETLLLLLMITAIPMIPYLLFYLSWPNEHGKSRKSPGAAILEFATRPFRKFAGWTHAHPLLHH